MATTQKAKPKTKGAKGPKTTNAKSTQSAKPDKKMSALDAAARVLTENKEPMSCAQLIETMAAKGYWKSPGGKTPSATLSSAIQREIDTKKAESRFEKTAPGRYTTRRS